MAEVTQSTTKLSSLIIRNKDTLEETVYPIEDATAEQRLDELEPEVNTLKSTQTSNSQKIKNLEDAQSEVKYNVLSTQDIVTICQ